MDGIKECKICVNTTINPSIKINSKGICNVCEHYNKYFNKEDLEKELEFIKKFIKDEKYDCMVGLSGGKDSSAMLYTTKKLGFTPLAFSFEIGYNEMSDSVKAKIKRITQKLEVDYETIDINNYMSSVDKECLEKMSDLYEQPLTDEFKEKFREIYNEGRKYYSTKQNISFPSLL